MAKTKLMAILNATTDSFYAESRHLGLEEAIATALRFQAEGADIIDIGGESSRPGAIAISEEEEFKRVIPIIKEIKKHIRLPISIDTTKPNIAKAAIAAGATLINDITGFSQPEMIQIAKESQQDICVMHMQGTPQSMQQNPHYPNGIIPELMTWFKIKINTLISAGIKPDNIILDPGIGFGKTVADNLEIIHNLSLFKSLGFRVLLGVSRKTFLRKILNKPPEDVLAATLAINAIAIAAKVDIIRVHDVKQHRDVIDTVDAYLNPTEVNYT